MTAIRPFALALDRLTSVGLRPTRQRMALARLLFESGDRHLTAEQLYDEAVSAHMPVSLATVYNTLHQFTEAGLLREVVVEAGRSYFDTNTSSHHHFFDQRRGYLIDIPGNVLEGIDLPTPPEGMRITRVDMVIHMQPALSGEEADASGAERADANGAESRRAA